MDTKTAKRELEKEVCLAEIAEETEKRDKPYTFGVIIDICEPFKFEDKDEYVTKIKIIDQSFNFKPHIKNKDIKFHKFVTIHVYTKRPEDAPKAKYVGDIIRLRRFHFVLSNRGELIGYETKFSNWMIHKGGKGEAVKPTNYKVDWDKNKNREFTKYEVNRLNDLRNWAHTYFANHRIKFITWWSPLIEPQNEKEAAKDKIASTDVDIILKATHINNKEFQIQFVDHSNKKYLLTLKNSPVLKEGKVIKLRCINVIYTKEIRVIQLTQKSSCLLVPDHFSDATAFGKKGVSPKASTVKTPDRFSKTPDHSKSRTPEKRTAANSKNSKSPAPSRGAKSENSDYEFKKGEITSIKKSYHKQKVTPIRDLLEILEDPSNYQHRRFVVKGYILGFSQDKLSQIVKKQAGSKVLTFDAKAKNVTNYMFHFTINLKDSSIEDSDEILSTYVLTNEGVSDIFDKWNILPATNKVSEWEGLSKTKITSFEKKFNALKTGHHEGKFVVELLLTASGKPFFKLYDTVFA